MKTLTLCLLVSPADNLLQTDWIQINVGPDLDPICLTLMVFLKEFFKKLILKKKISRQQKSIKITQ